MSFENHRHALWRELLNCEPINAEDESALSGYLNWVQHQLREESKWANERLMEVTAFLEERAFVMSRMTIADQANAVAYRYRRKYRQDRDAWQKTTPRFLTKAEHDALMDRPTTKAIDKEEYERMMREAQQ